jgi:hypothetical protein
VSRMQSDPRGVDDEEGGMIARRWQPAPYIPVANALSTLGLDVHLAFIQAPSSIHGQPGGSTPTVLREKELP